MEDPSNFKIQKRTDALDFKSSLLGPENKTYRKSFFVALGIGVLVAGGVMALGSAFFTVWLSYLMPMHLAEITVKAIPPLFLILLIVGAELFLKPKPLSSAERDRFASLKGETPEEIKELIGFNLRTGNRAKANEWAAKALKLSNGESVPKIEKKN